MKILQRIKYCYRRDFNPIVFKDTFYKDLEEIVLLPCIWLTTIIVTICNTIRYPFNPLYIALTKPDAIDRLIESRLDRLSKRL